MMIPLLLMEPGIGVGLATLSIGTRQQSEKRIIILLTDGCETIGTIDPRTIFQKLQKNTALKFILSELEQTVKRMFPVAKDADSKLVFRKCL